VITPRPTIVVTAATSEIAPATLAVMPFATPNVSL